MRKLRNIWSLIYNLKKINKLQKLNIILKLNDYISYKIIYRKVTYTKIFKDNF